MLQEFKDFIAMGNVMGMAVGMIIGAAFIAIVKSMVWDLINPFIGLFMGGVDFTNMFVVRSGEGIYASLTEAQDTSAAVFAYDAFIMAVINFLIVAFVVFMLVRYVNTVKESAAKEEEAAPAPEEPKWPTELEVLLGIRVSLKK